MPGPDNWPGRWKRKQRRLATDLDWSRFRRDAVLMEGIQTSPAQLKKWVALCEGEGVHVECMRDSRFGDPQGQDVGGVFATATSARHAYMVERLSRHMINRFGLRVWEIGGGYGGFAMSMSRKLSIAEYHVSDGPACVEMQRRFIAKVCGLSVKKWDHASKYDVVVNTNSFGEMDVADVDHYFGHIQEQLEDGGVLYTVNRLNRVTDFAQYPYDQKWRHHASLFVGDHRWVECVSRRDSTADSAHPAQMFP